MLVSNAKGMTVKEIYQPQLWKLASRPYDRMNPDAVCPGPTDTEASTKPPDEGPFALDTKA
jgi:hypothetical protein